MSPIRPENRGRYPKSWKAIRAQILERAENRCEFCGVANRTFGYRAADGSFVRPKYGDWTGERKLIEIVLTIAHLDHTPENCAPENLRALCQRCHLRYDREHHAKSRRENAQKDQLRLI